MKIARSDIADYVGFLHPKASPLDIRPEVARLEVNFDDISGENETVFIQRGADGKICGRLCLVRLQDGVFGLANPFIVADRDHEKVFAALLSETLDECRRRGARRVHYRLNENIRTMGEADILLKNGFSFIEKRLEFKSELKDLPDGAGGPFSWEKPRDLSVGEVMRLARLLYQCSQGDPSATANDDHGQQIHQWLHESGLTAGPECFDIARLDGRDAGLIVAQVNPQNGWSRISYMGLLPEFRGKGFGLWLHRRGFDMLRAQGGQVYHGGTSATNRAMIALFRANKCRDYRTLQEWCRVF